MEFNEEESIHFLKELFSHVCKIVVAGPLMRTNCEAEFLLKLQEDLLNGITQGLPITSNRSALNYSVKVRKMLGIKCKPNEGDTLCFEIRQNVTKRLQKGHSGASSSSSMSTSRLLLGAMLSSCGSSGYEMRRVCRTPNTHLPVCIYAGHSKAWDIVKKVIYTVLNCSFVAPRFSQNNVKVIAGLWILERMKCDELESDKLKYIMKPRTNDKSVGNLELQLQMKLWMDIWERTPQDANKLLSSDLVGETIKNWDEIITTMFNESRNTEIDEIQGLDVHEIIMSTFYFSKRGEIKLRLYDKESFLPILAYLTSVLSGNESYEICVPMENSPVPVTLPNRKKMAVQRKARKNSSNKIVNGNSKRQN